MFKSHAQLWFGLALFVFLLGGVQLVIGWGHLLEPWRTIEPAILLIAALLTLISYIARTLRLYDYFLPETRGGLIACLKLTLLHNFFNNLLPMRTGETSFPVLMSRYFSTSLARSLAALLWFRLMDLHVLGAVVFVTVGSIWLDVWLVGFLLILWLTLAWWMFRLQSAPVLATLVRRLSPHWRDWLVQARDGLPQTRNAFWRAWIWTLTNWLLKLVVFAWILQLFAPMPAAGALLGAIGGDLTSVLPVHGIAGAGSYEAGVVAALLPFGVPGEAALAAAVNLHLFMLGMSLAGGILGLLLPYDLRPT
jgi:uncharacterized membrane protein YbhN (UPF0104 family)